VRFVREDHGVFDGIDDLYRVIVEKAGLDSISPYFGYYRLV